MAVLSPTFVAPQRVTCVPGYATSSTCKILVVTLDDPSSNAVTVTVNGTAYVASLTARGSPTVCWTGVVTATGLSEFTRYTWSVTQSTNTDSGSLMTAPGVSDDFSFYFASCDCFTWSHGDERAWLAAGSWDQVKNYHDAGGNIAGILFNDDLGYVDSKNFDDSANSGLASSGVPSATLNVNDYLKGYCAYLGMCGPSTGTVDHTAQASRTVWYPRETNRAWVRKNINLWPQWGDHEFANDIGFDNDATAGSNARWTTYATVDGPGKTAWDAIFGLIQPTYTKTLDTVTNHWVMRVGCTTIATLDPITRATGNGGALTTLGSPTAITTIWGTNQIDDVLNSINTNKSDFTFIGMQNSIRYPVSSFAGLTTDYGSGAQHPVYDHCLAEYQRLFTRSTDISLMNMNHTNGVAGVSMTLHGDYHRGYVYKHIKAAYANNKAEEFMSIGVGTVDGSVNFAIESNGVQATGETKGDVTATYLSPGLGYAGTGADNNDMWALRVNVNGSSARRNCTVTLFDHDGDTLWSGTFYKGRGNLPVTGTQSFPLTPIAIE